MKDLLYLLACSLGIQVGTPSPIPLQVQGSWNPNSSGRRPHQHRDWAPSSSHHYYGRQKDSDQSIVTVCTRRYLDFLHGTSELTKEHFCL
ncbi:hypothetical protein CPAR01_14386 [Colletotrichum paranaense]|uniref:Secreted protein n=1 Tax=Colletotrichum paranaense TaxID=1914294 RepID=A0ABQ9S2K9_9PEZI|nr:uncharacterized protein CPAR01_14386 [Colletotrichum paranaense]KAK1522843.1 hypothetical protein CPAR01_14386 [Colletotrichum paranaense]